MTPAFLIPIFLLLFVILMNERTTRQAAQKQVMKRKKRRKGENTVIELAKKMIGKECLVYTFNGSQLTGTVREVEGCGMILDNGKELEVVNLDFVVRIREYPKKKNGKNKSVVLD